MNKLITSLTDKKLLITSDLQSQLKEDSFAFPDSHPLKVTYLVTNSL